MNLNFVILLADGVAIVVVGGKVVKITYQGEAPRKRGIAQEMTFEAMTKRLHNGLTGR